MTAISKRQRHSSRQGMAARRSAARQRPSSRRHRIGSIDFDPSPHWLAVLASLLAGRGRRGGDR